MKNIYITDSRSKESSAKILESLEATAIFPSDFFEELIHAKEKDLQKIVERIIGDEEKVNIISQNYSCNIAAISLLSPKVNRVILISPEFVKPDIIEQWSIASQRSKENNYDEEIKPKEIIISSESAADFTIFDRTSKAARFTIEATTKQVLIIFSKGDPLVSQKYLNAISKKPNIEVIGLNSCSNTPLHGPQSEKVLKIIKDKVSHN